MKTHIVNYLAYFTFFICGHFVLRCQTQVGKLDTVFCDCATARELKLRGGARIGPTISPPGAGEKNEISQKSQRSQFVFKEEHHSAWYKLIFTVSGNFSLDILPANPLDDYDFILFKANSQNICDDLEKGKIKPARSNLSREKDEIRGKTGLSLLAKNAFVPEGVHAAYSSSIKVEQGEVYYLVLDNVYDNGGGHTISFSFEQKVEIKGVVLDEENKPQITRVTVTDIKGETVAECVTKPKTGLYDVLTVLRKNTQYSINYFSDSSFVHTKTFTVRDTTALQNISVILPKLKKGKKYSMGAINFFGGSPEYVPGARPSIENLYRLMCSNKNLEIQIEGHVNCAGIAEKFQKYNEDFTVELSFERAKAIMDFLVKKGIDKKRISIIGKGCTEMLFPLSTKDFEVAQNRRVEIKVLEF
jgi:outer membrane protein OmpA-like peptidoglycan-associated protein